MYTVLQGSVTYVFPCRRWLARDEEDGAIERELLPEKATKEIISKDGQVKTQELKIQDKLKGMYVFFTRDVEAGIQNSLLIKDLTFLSNVFVSNIAGCVSVPGLIMKI